MRARALRSASTTTARSSDVSICAIDLTPNDFRDKDRARPHLRLHAGCGAAAGRRASRSARRWRTPSSIGDGAVINPEGLRYPDEFVRHKLLDTIGDLALAGAPIQGLYRSHRGGHKLNAMALSALLARTTPGRSFPSPPSAKRAPKTRASSARCSQRRLRPGSALTSVFKRSALATARPSLDGERALTRSPRPLSKHATRPRAFFMFIAETPFCRQRPPPLAWRLPLLPFIAAFAVAGLRQEEARDGGQRRSARPALQSGARATLKRAMRSEASEKFETIDKEHPYSE